MNTLAPKGGFSRVWNSWLTDTELIRNPRKCQVLLWALKRASFCERSVFVGGNKIDLRPGQFLFGRVEASQELGMSEGQFRRTVTGLQNDQLLTIKTTNKFSVGTIANWEFRGDGTVDYDHQNDQHSDQQTDQKPATNKDSRSKTKDLNQKTRTLPPDGEKRQPPYLN